MSLTNDTHFPAGAAPEASWLGMQPSGPTPANKNFLRPKLCSACNKFKKKKNQKLHLERKMSKHVSVFVRQVSLESFCPDFIEFEQGVREEVGKYSIIE
jgi:hypothetical protein